MARLTFLWSAVLLSGALSSGFAGYAQTAAAPAKLDRMYVFGDSYSDMGEGYLDSNGPTAVAYLADRLGFKLWPSNTNKVRGRSLDYAVSGAQTGSGIGQRMQGALFGYGMKNQVDDFAAQIRSHTIEFRPETTLFFVAGGLNDSRLADGVSVSNEKDEIRTLYGLGARRFAVALLPEAIPGFGAQGKRLNMGLAKIPDDLKGELKDADIRMSHWGLFFDDVLLHPERYGMTNTTDPCVGRDTFNQPTQCPTPDTYFFYYASHPSTATHKAVGAMLYTEITGAAAK